MGSNRQGIKKGSKISVDPIRDIKDIKSINKLLESNPRNLLLWIMGINNGLRASDIVKLKVSDVCDLKQGDVLNIYENKTGKKNILVINKQVFKSLQVFLKKCKPDICDFLFKSRKGNSHITSKEAGALIKSWTKSLNLKGTFGAHSLRKTWGYHQRKTYGVGFEIICKRYQHSNPNVTMRYLGIEDKEVKEVLMNNGLG
jgi:integrase